MAPEKVKPVGAVGGVVSSLTDLAWRRADVADVVLGDPVDGGRPALVMLRLALAPATSVPLVTVSLPLMVGALPSVV